jgi:hypothetical protein|tara:strand:- start:540 stop:749 length:210 start_codon:yes stop_codon:yes gene_type:complete
MRFVVEPVSIKAVPVRVDQSTKSVCLVIFPEALVFASVFPDLGTFALAVAVLGPVSEVDGAVVKFMGTL